MLFESKVPAAFLLSDEELLTPVNCDLFRESSPKCECGHEVERHYSEDALLRLLADVDFMWHGCSLCFLDSGSAIRLASWDSACPGYWRKSCA